MGRNVYLSTHLEFSLIISVLPNTFPLIFNWFKSKTFKLSKLHILTYRRQISVDKKKDKPV